MPQLLHTSSIQLPDYENEREEWSRALRKILSPCEILFPDGSINQDYFKPAIYKKRKVLSEDGKSLWGGYEWSVLKSALCSEGVGEWEKIREKFLSQWSVQVIEQQTKYILGTGDIQQYIGWTPSGLDEISQVLESNRKKALEENRWIDNLYIPETMTQESDMQSADQSPQKHTANATSLTMDETS
eukprot:jgi/Galph1/3059/GphlegSOOS_G1719.1